MSKKKSSNQPIIIKKNGVSEPFDPAKLKRSLRNSGASNREVEMVYKHITSEIKDGVTTNWIYQHAFEQLRKIGDRPTSFRYSLRRAVSEMGPSGFPFEKFIGQIYDRDGYTVQVGKKIKGKCVSHEVDVIAENETEIVTAELKFHNKHNLQSDLKTILYVNERFRDIEASGYYGEKKKKAMVITNTKFSANAISYAECVGLGLLGWNYPRGGAGLHDVIAIARVHPVTAIASFTKKEQQQLLDAGFVSCRDIKRNNGQDVLKTGIIKENKLKKAWGDIDAICGIK